MTPMRGLRFLTSVVLLSLVASLPACQRSPRFDYDFESPTILDDLHWQCGTLFRIAAEHATSGSRSLEVSFYPGPAGDGERYPGLSLADFNSDLSGYGTLTFDAFVPGDSPISLGLRIDDRVNPDYADRFNRGIPLSPGMNHIAIPLSELIASGSRRPLNLEKIQAVVLFMANPKEQHTVFFDRLRVE